MLPCPRGQFQHDWQETGRYEIYVRPFSDPGGQWQISADGGISARWSSDGKELYFIAPDGKLVAAPITVNGSTLEPGEPFSLFQTQINGGGGSAQIRQQYDVAADGRFLINVETEDPAPSPITVILNWNRLQTRRWAHDKWYLLWA